MYAGKTVCSWYDAADPPDDEREVLVWAQMFGEENYAIARYADDKWNLFIPMTTVLIAAPQNVTVLYWRPLPLSPPENELLAKRRELCKKQGVNCSKKCPLYQLRKDYENCTDAILDYPEEAERLMNGKADKKQRAAAKVR